MANNTRHRRKKPPHLAAVCRDGRPVIEFVTVVSGNRKPILANDDAVATVVGAWREATFWKIGPYVFMPDHIHLLATPIRGDVPVTVWVAFWKSLASRRWPRPWEHPVWQRGCWDRQLRDTENIRQRTEYFLNNPVRAGLVSDAGDWPFAGEMNVLG